MDVINVCLDELQIITSCNSHVHQDEVQSIPKLPITTTYTDFFHNFMLKNKPCVISNATANWEATKRWVDGKDINYQYLITKYGEKKVPVADCEKFEYNSHCKKDMVLEEYLTYLKEVQCSDKPGSHNLYLKDWHLRKDIYPEQFYTIPEYFASDWLNEYAIDHNEDDFMFVYIGPKSSWTPFHVDVYTSYSWSSNVVGRKHWILLPPGEEIKLKDSLGNLPTDIKPKRTDDIRYYEVIQETGEVIFVPSGWHHQVCNLEQTISINHNWVNGCNIMSIWHALKLNQSLVQNEIKEYEDSEGWEDQYQLILKSLFGMNSEDFLNLVTYIASKRILQMTDENILMFDKYRFNKRHLLFDLVQIKAVLNCMLTDKLYIDNHLEKIATLKTDIDKFTEK